MLLLELMAGVLWLCRCGFAWSVFPWSVFPSSCPNLFAIKENCFGFLCFPGVFEVSMPSAGPVSVLSWTSQFSAVQADCCCRLWVFSCQNSFGPFYHCVLACSVSVKTPYVTHPFVKQNDRLPSCELWSVCHATSLQFADLVCHLTEVYSFVYHLRSDQNLFDHVHSWR